jgi:hypothetical protein
MLKKPAIVRERLIGRKWSQIDALGVDRPLLKVGECRLAGNGTVAVCSTAAGLYR